MTIGERLEITGAPATAENPEHRHQQQVPLRVTHPPAVTAVGDRLEETDQVDRCVLLICAAKGFGHGGERDPLTKPEAESPAKDDIDILLGSPALVVGVLNSLQMRMSTISLWQLVVESTMIAAGAGLMFRSLKGYDDEAENRNKQK